MNTIYAILHQSACVDFDLYGWVKEVSQCYFLKKRQSNALDAP